MNKITIKQFGKDHWSLLLYIETRIHDYKGVLDMHHMRIKNRAIYGTRLFGYWNKDGIANSLLQLHNHQEQLILKIKKAYELLKDDYDCLCDLEAEDLIKNIGTGLRPVCTVTKKGAEILSQLLLHKQNGGYHSNFIPNRKEKMHETIPDTKS